MENIRSASGTLCGVSGNQAGDSAKCTGQMDQPVYQDQSVTLYCGDCRKIIPQLDSGIDLLLTDPPYSHVKEEAWDKISRSELADLLDAVFRETRKKLASNAAIYVFAWPKFAGTLEALMAEHFHVLQHIVWNKREPNGRLNGMANKQHLPALRNFFAETERIIFAEQCGADAAYYKKSQNISTHVFQPLIDYFTEAKRKSGFSSAEIREKMFALTGKRSVFDRHTFSKSQWAFPSKEQYLAAATFLPLGDYNATESNYQNALLAYNTLKQKYRELRRYHHPNKRNFTDLWNYRPIMPGKKERIHPCQKPLDMLTDMIEASCRPDGLVLDAFAGSGQTAVAAKQCGRKCILIEQDPEMCQKIIKRLEYME